MIKKIFFIIYFFSIYLFFPVSSFSDIKKDLINKLNQTKTLSFDFEQTIADKTEIGTCFIKYPLLMKCNYKNLKEKIIISNGKTLAVIKKKYKKIYFYPLKSTPLYFILKKDKIINLIKENKLYQTNLKLIKFEFFEKNKNKIEIFFDKNTLNLKGWKTKDNYSNNVEFKIKNLKINNQIVDEFFQIPEESSL